MVDQVLLLASRVRVDELSVDKVTMKEAVCRIVRMAKKRDRPGTCAGATSTISCSQSATPSSVRHTARPTSSSPTAPVLWLSRIASSAPLPERVTGSDLFWELSRVSGEANLRLFFLGGLPGAAAKAAEAVEQRYPGARVVGTYCPPPELFDTEAEQERIRRVVRQAAPDILLVALGAPKQEKWIARNKDALGVPVSIGVGGSFELAAGIHRRAPKWLQRLGLEWFYRFAQEPRRLFRRYFVNDMPYLAGAAARALTRRVRGLARPPG
jgi:N-acetylglucosaminyldiphosphoundecaprenol N-acetyl-beta-D-mannosaminyltransferase